MCARAGTQSVRNLKTLLLNSISTFEVSGFLFSKCGVLTDGGALLDQRVEFNLPFRAPSPLLLPPVSLYHYCVHRTIEVPFTASTTSPGLALRENAAAESGSTLETSVTLAPSSY